MCCLVVQCSTKASHDDEALPQFREPLRFFVRFDGISVPVTTPAPMIPGREKTSWNIGKTRFKFALPLAVWCGQPNLYQKNWVNSPTQIDPIIHQPWIRSYCCGQWGWDSLLKRSQTVDVAFGGCLWSLATGLKLEKSLWSDRFILSHMVQWCSMAQLLRTWSLLQGISHIFPDFPIFPKHPTPTPLSRLPGAIPMALKSDFSGSGFAMAVTTNGVRSVEIEATILPQLHSCRIKVKGLQPCTIFPACPEVLRFENSKDIKGIYGIYLYIYRWTQMDFPGGSIYMTYVRTYIYAVLCSYTHIMRINFWNHNHFSCTQVHSVSWLYLPKLCLTCPTWEHVSKNIIHQLWLTNLCQHVPRFLDKTTRSCPSSRNFYGHIWIEPRKIDGYGDRDDNDNDNDDDDSCHKMLSARCFRNAFYGNKSTQLFFINSSPVPRWGLDS